MSPLKFVFALGGWSNSTSWDGRLKERWTERNMTKDIDRTEQGEQGKSKRAAFTYSTFPGATRRHGCIIVSLNDRGRCRWNNLRDDSKKRRYNGFVVKNESHDNRENKYDVTWSASSITMARYDLQNRSYPAFVTETHTLALLGDHIEHERFDAAHFQFPRTISIPRGRGGISCAGYSYPDFFSFCFPFFSFAVSVFWGWSEVEHSTVSSEPSGLRRPTWYMVVSVPATPDSQTLIRRTLSRAYLPTTNGFDGLNLKGQNPKIYITLMVISYFQSDFVMRSYEERSSTKVSD